MYKNLQKSIEVQTHDHNTPFIVRTYIPLLQVLRDLSPLCKDCITFTD